MTLFQVFGVCNLDPTGDTEKSLLRSKQNFAPEQGIKLGVIYF